MDVQRLNDDEAQEFLRDGDDMDEPEMEEPSPDQVRDVKFDDEEDSRPEEDLGISKPIIREATPQDTGSADEVINGMMQAAEPPPPPPPQPVEMRQRALPPPPPAGFTDILPQDMPNALHALGTAFKSLSPTGIVGDFGERSQYALAVMDNSSIGSDIRAQIVDQFMTDGKVVPEALPESWWNGLGLQLQKRPATEKPLPPGIDPSQLFGGGQ